MPTTFPTRVIPLTIDEFARRVRSKEVTATEVLEGCLQRIEAQNPTLNAFILVTANEARREARRADQELAAGQDRGPLHGVPISIKDLFDVTDTPTTAASRVRDGHVANTDATAITRLRQAGAVLIGKTNLHEFAFGTTNEDSGYGPARHPLDPSRSPGGSSGSRAGPYPESSLVVPNANSWRLVLPMRTAPACRSRVIAVASVLAT